MNNNEKGTGDKTPIPPVGVYWHYPDSDRVHFVNVATEPDAQEVKRIFQKVGLEVSIIIDCPPKEGDR